MIRRFARLVVVLLAVGCGDDGAGGSMVDRDAGTCPGGCDDGLYCNGAELCAPASGLADENGCVAGTPPCDALACDEASDRCADCPDADGDGAADAACGGTDCDDADASRFPAAREICDAADVDEDCDPTTFGFRDLDGDTIGDAACCNVAGDGTRTCGADCDDTDPAIRGAGAPELCDTIDNDCDGLSDEGAITTYTVDADGDDFGSAAPGATTAEACSQPEGFSENALDCDDADPNVNPGAPEICAPPGGDPVDDDCDMRVDEGRTIRCWPDADGDRFAPLGAAPVDVCLEACGEGLTATEPADAASADCDDARAEAFPMAPEICNRFDDNCDGSDPTLEDQDGDGFAPEGTTVCVAGSGPDDFPLTDCNDNPGDPNAPDINPDARPSDVPIGCEPGFFFCPCTGGHGYGFDCVDRPDVLCDRCATFVATEAHNFDRNCSGFEDPQPPFPGGICVSIAGRCTDGGPVPVERETAAQCGRLVTSRACNGDCREIRALRPLACN